MAANADPLARQQIAVQARDTGDRLVAPRTNTTLQLAESLRDLQPEAAALGQHVGEQLKSKAEAQAHQDVLRANGANMADAVRMGTIEPTQNPWYMQAYRREAAAVNSQQDFQRLSVESQNWPEKNDPVAFDKRWREEVGLIARRYDGLDETAGFAPVEAQFTQQALATNTAQNVQRIEQERFTNISALSASALSDTASRNGGVLTPEAAYAALEPARVQWFATGGGVTGWNSIVEQSVYTAARNSKNPAFVDILQSPTLLAGPQVEGQVGAPPHPDTLSPVAPAIATVDPDTGLPSAGPILNGGESPDPIAPVAPAPTTASTAIQPNRGNPSSRVAWPAMGRVPEGGSFGSPRSGGPAHSGLDIAVPIGTPVTAPPRQGTVYRVGEDARSGKYVILDMGGGVFSSYAHLSRVDVTRGQTIDPGAAVGLSGNTGNSRGPHIHWRVRVGGAGGRSVDPRTVDFGQEQTPGDPAVPNSAGPGFAPNGVDQPYRYVPPNAQTGAPFQTGPTLYNMPGVSQRAEETRYYIGKQAEEQQTAGLRQIRAQRQARGAEGLDILWQTYGNKLLTGDFDQNTIISDLSGRGYSGPEIAETLGQLRSVTTDSAGLMSSRTALRGNNPETAQRNLDLFSEGARNGYSPEYEAKLGQAILRGDLDGGDANRYLDNAIGTTNRVNSEQRSDRAEQRTVLNQYNGLNSQIRQLSGAVVTGGLAARKRSGTRTAEPDYDWTVRNKPLVEQAMRAEAERWLATHPGDFPGALDAARTKGNEILVRWIGSHQPRTAAQPTGGRAGGGNPRRQ